MRAGIAARLYRALLPVALFSVLFMGCLTCELMHSKLKTQSRKEVGPMDTEENMKDERQIKLIWNICNLISELNDLLWDHYEEEFFEHEELIYRGRLTDHKR